jgi:hypothetical protein
LVATEHLVTRLHTRVLKYAEYRDQRENMNGIKIPIGQRPNYFDGQLLLAKDFLDEQRYHMDARRRHNLFLHDWGVARGLTIAKAHDRSVRIAPGAAVDAAGNEIRVDESSVVDLSAFRPHDRVHICLAYEEAASQPGTRDNNRVDCYANMTVAHNSDPHPELILGTVTLDAQGRVNEDAIDYTQTKYARLAAGSVTAVQLHDELRRGWLRLPFRPDPMVEGPEAGTEAGLPAFRIGATEALSPDPKEAGERDRGAAGTMAIPVPPSVKYVTRFRIAGMENKGEISMLLMRGGWDTEGKKHVRDVLIEEKIVRKEPFMEIYTVKEKQTALDPEYHTLALWLKGTRRTAISLIAVEFGF